VNLPSTGIICVDEDGFLLDVNEDAIEILGYTEPGEVKGKAIYEFMDDKDKEMLRNKIKCAMESNTTCSSIIFINYPDQQLLKTEINLTPWLNDTDKKRTLCTIRTLAVIPANESRRKASLNKALESFKSVVGSDAQDVTAEDEDTDELLQHNIWMFGIDADGVCKTWNTYCEKYFGYSKDDVLNKKTLFELLDPAQTDGITVVLKSALTSEKSFSADIKFIPRPGKSNFRRGHISIIKSMEFQGKNSGYVCMFYPLDVEDEENQAVSENAKGPAIAISDPMQTETYPLAREAEAGADCTVRPAERFDSGPGLNFANPSNFMNYNDFAIVSPGGDIKFVSSNFVQQLGFNSVNELKEHNWFELITRQSIKDMFVSTGDDSGSNGSGEFYKPTRVPYKTKEGGVMETELQVIPMYDARGHITEALWLLNPNDGQPDIGPERRRPVNPPSGPPEPDKLPSGPERALLQLNQDLIALNLIADVIEQYNDFHEMLSAVMDTLIGVISVEYCALYLIKDDKLKLEYSLGIPADMETVALSTTTNAEKLMELTECSFKGSIKGIIRSNVTVPIISQGRNLGFISLASSHDMDFTNMDMDLINTVAHQVAGAILKQEFYSEYINLKREYNEFYDSSPDVYIKVDSNGIVRSCNKTSLKVFGLPQNGMIDKDLLSILRPKLAENHEKFDKWFEETLRSKSGKDIDVKLELENSEQRYYNIEAIEAAVATPGEESGLRLVLHDVTGHYKIKSFLRSANEIMEQIFNATNDLIIYIDMSRTIIECNKTVMDFLGYTRDELRGKFINVLYTNELLIERYFQKLEGVYSGEDEVRLEQVIRRKDGSMFVALVTACSVKNDLGDITGMALYFTDITNRKREEKELIAAKKDTSLYINILSHDLNNYNQCALSYIDILTRTDLEDDQKNYVNIIRDQLESSMRLSNNVKKLSEIKSRHAPLTSVDLNRALRKSATSIMEKSYRYEGIGELELQFDFPDGIYGVKADDLIEELFSNIFWNAVLHNTHKKKLLKIKISAPPANLENYWQIEIHDNAFGIPDEQKTLVFSPETHFENDSSSNGIGLSIINALIERYGGKLWVENRVPDDYTKGSVFKLLLKKAPLSMDSVSYGTGARC